MGFISDLKGTATGFIKLALNGVRLKNDNGNLVVRNSADSADAQITTSKITVTGNELTIGSAETITITRPDTGMSGNYSLTLPVNGGNSGDVLSTDGTGVLEWIAPSSSPSNAVYSTTTVAFDSSSPVTLFTLPANATMLMVRVVVDTAFDETPSLTIGISGNTDKYLSSSQIDLNAVDSYDVIPSVVPNVASESVIATYTANSATVGSARIIMGYFL
jgi:hypothetical protein